MARLSVPLSLLLALLGSGCARIYRPVALAQPPVAVRGPGLAGQAVPQPWGDNGRYERRAFEANLRVVALALENTSGTDLEVLRLDLPEGAHALAPEAAAGLVRQRRLPFLLFALVPGLAVAGASDPGPRYGPSDAAVFQALALVGLAVALPNAAIATRSNRRLEAFFREQAWGPGPMGPGQLRRGLVFLRTPAPGTPLPLGIVYRTPAGERRLDLVVPGTPRP